MFVKKKIGLNILDSFTHDSSCKRGLLSKQPPEAILWNFKAIFFSWELRGIFRQLQIKNKEWMNEKEGKEEKRDSK